MGVKISNLPAIATPALTDIFPVVQSGVTYKETMTQLINLFGFPVIWSNIAGTTQAAAVNNGYVVGNAGLTTITLPATSALGSILEIAGKGAGGWVIAQGAGQQIHIGSSVSTLGAGGSVASTNQYDSIKLVCITDDTIWSCVGGPQSSGLTVV